MFEVVGSPIGGENPPHDRAWRQRVAEHAAGQAHVRAVALHFRLEEHRQVDLDNLVRPALAGLRDAGMFTRGFTNLQLLLATKTAHGPVGLTVQVGHEVDRSATGEPGPTLLRVSSPTLPREGDRESKAAWRERVHDNFAGPPVGGPVWVDVGTRVARSLEGVMKPVIDGLEPFLGRDPKGRLDFVPNDHLVVHLRMRRQPDLPVTLALTAGTVTSDLHR